MTVVLLAVPRITLRQQAPDPRVADLVRAGRVRIALFSGQYTKDPVTGELKGVWADVAQAFAARVGVRLVLVEFPTPPKMVECLKAAACDVGFLGYDPSRAPDVEGFTSPFIEFDYTYLVPSGSSIRSGADADQPGVRVAVVRAHASTLTLTRIRKHAELVSVDTPDSAFELLRTGRVDAWASARQVLVDYSAQLAGSRVLESRYGVNRAAMVVAQGEAARLAYLNEFIEAIKASGFVQRAITRSGWRGVRVAPPQGPTPREALREPWIVQLGYSPDQVFSTHRGPHGMPFVDVVIEGTAERLLFDTGNMAGLTLATPLIDRLRLPESGRWDRLDSDGRVIGSYRRTRASSVILLGRTLSDQTMLEFSDAELGGLVGPGDLPGTRFTLDYQAELLAVANSSLLNVPPGFVALPLKRSARHPRLILAMGRVNGRPVLMEFDTGASRTNIDPQLVHDLGLVPSGDGVRIDSLAVGCLVFSVSSAKVDSKSGIDPGLVPPLQLSVGSDILAQLIFTVDYAAGQLLVLDARRP